MDTITCEKCGIVNDSVERRMFGPNQSTIANLCSSCTRRINMEIIVPAYTTCNRNIYKKLDDWLKKDA